MDMHHTVDGAVSSGLWIRKLRLESVMDSYG